MDTEARSLRQPRRVMTASSDVILQLMELAVVTSTMYKNTASGTKEQLRRDQVQTEVVQATEFR